MQNMLFLLLTGFVYLVAILAALSLIAVIPALQESLHVKEFINTKIPSIRTRLVIFIVALILGISFTVIQPNIPDLLARLFTIEEQLDIPSETPNATEFSQTQQTEGASETPRLEPTSTVTVNTPTPIPTATEPKPPLPTTTSTYTPTPSPIPPPYFVQNGFGCKPGSEWRFDDNACAALRLTIRSNDLENRIQVCRPFVSYSSCWTEEELPITELTAVLEWRFLITNYGNFGASLRPTVVVGNSNQGEIARSTCTLGRQGQTVLPDSESTDDWYHINSRSTVSVYCSLEELDYTKVEWAVVLVDYEVAYTRYFVSKSYEE